MKRRFGVFSLSTILLAGTTALSLTRAADGAEASTPRPTAKAWADLAELPDWSGVWSPDLGDQNKQMKTNPPPWTPRAAAQIAAREAEEKAGNPFLVFMGCLPHGMPSWMLVTHNVMEILFTPGRVTMLGEVDGNRLRRIYTDGRKHPEDPDLSFHGHSIGHWEGQTLVVDTVGILPETYIAVSEAVGMPNNGDMHIVERIHLTESNVLHVDMTITAPKVLTRPWKTTRIYYRHRDHEVLEGVCMQGQFAERQDKNGNWIYEPRPETDTGVPAPVATH